MLLQQMMDSPIETTRVFWRRKYGFPDILCNDPRPIADIINERYAGNISDMHIDEAKTHQLQAQKWFAYSNNVTGALHSFARWKASEHYAEARKELGLAMHRK